jgi:hypothetical protein
MEIPPTGSYFDARNHAYYLDSLRIFSVTQALLRARVIDYSMVPGHVLEAARRRGRRVHSALHYWAQQDLDMQTVGPQTSAYMDGAMRWIEKHVATINAVEKPLFNPHRKFGGTPDLDTVLCSGDWAIVDYKTGWRSPGHAVQLCAYASMKPEPLRYRLIILYLRQDGRADVVEVPKAFYQHHLAVFYSALQCAQFSDEHGVNVWGGL